MIRGWRSSEESRESSKETIPGHWDLMHLKIKVKRKGCRAERKTRSLEKGRLLNSRSTTAFKIKTKTTSILPKGHSHTSNVQNSSLKTTRGGQHDTDGPGRPLHDLKEWMTTTSDGKVHQKKWIPPWTELFPFAVSKHNVDPFVLQKTTNNNFRWFQRRSGPSAATQ